MKRALVTGADGFIGSHLTEMLVGRGYKVTALAQYNSFNDWGWLDKIDNKIRIGLSQHSHGTRMFILGGGPVVLSTGESLKFPEIPVISGDLRGFREISGNIRKSR